MIAFWRFIKWLFGKNTEIETTTSTPVSPYITQKIRASQYRKLNGNYYSVVTGEIVETALLLEILQGMQIQDYSEDTEYNEFTDFVPEEHQAKSETTSEDIAFNNDFYLPPSETLSSDTSKVETLSSSNSSSYNSGRSDSGSSDSGSSDSGSSD